MGKIVGDVSSFGTLWIDNKTEKGFVTLSYKGKVLDKWEEDKEDKQVLAMSVHNPTKYLIHKKMLWFTVGDRVLFCPKDLRANDRTIKSCSFRVRDVHWDSNGVVYSVSLENVYDAVIQYYFVDVSYIRLMTKR